MKRPIRASVRRTAASFAVGAGLLLTLAACAESDAGPSASTITIQPSTYRIRNPATTTTTPTVNTADAQGRSPVEQAYVVESGDYPVKIAELYDVDLEELSNFNDWTPPNYLDFPSAGETVRIPPGAKFIDPDEPEATEPEDEREDEGEDETEPTEADEPTTTTVPRDRCDPGTYTIESGDYPLVVAEKFDVTVEALNQANAATQGYGSFFEGLEIVIPPASDC